jgi:hypothetical protein
MLIAMVVAGGAGPLGGLESAGRADLIVGIQTTGSPYRMSILSLGSGGDYWSRS